MSRPPACATWRSRPWPTCCGGCAQRASVFCWWSTTWISSWAWPTAWWSWSSARRSPRACRKRCSRTRLCAKLTWVGWSDVSEVRPILEVAGLGVSYGKVEALHDAAIKVGVGQIVTVIGPNGAGKTTLLAAIMGVLPHSRGNICFRGETLRDIEVERMVARGMNLVPEKRELFGAMSVDDNLLLGAFHRYRQGLRDQE